MHTWYTHTWYTHPGCTRKTLLFQDFSHSQLFFIFWLWPLHLISPGCEVKTFHTHSYFSFFGCGPCFKIPPWHADGSVNPLGVPDNRFVEPVLPGFELPIEYDSKTGWNCHKCHEWISLPPRKFEGGVEPKDWLWCMACRKKKPKMTARQKKLQAEVAQIHDISRYAKRN